MLLLFCVLEFLKSLWGVAAGEHCRDGLLAFFMFFLRECAVFLGCCSWRTLQRWTACLFMFFCANARSFWGVVAGEHCRDGLPAFFMFFCANARSFWGVATMDCLHFAFYNFAGVSIATFNEFFFWQVHPQHTDLVIS